MAKKSNSFAGSWIVRNLIAGVVFVALVIGAVSIFLSVRTRHGKEVTVPDLSGLSIADARSVAGSAGLRIVVTDSVYMRRVPRGAVVSQLPRATAAVKPGRKISLTVNSQVPKKVTMPNLIHVSLRQAKAELSSKGLVLGKLNYVSDIATNNVLRQQVRGHDIEPGKEIYSGTTVDLVLGLNGSDAMTYVPKLNGYKYLSAIDALHDNSLNVSALIFDKSVKSYSDSLAATVYSQRPAATGYPTVMGTGVTLYLTLDADKSAE
ncbi:MAG: PASTA domain-containing protein [Bacteroidales bacterium]|nr:PASTA domain-containing protein [Bacteroidales bacterium]